MKVKGLPSSEVPLTSLFCPWRAPSSLLRLRSVFGSVSARRELVEAAGSDKKIQDLDYVIPIGKNTGRFSMRIMNPYSPKVKAASWTLQPRNECRLRHSSGPTLASDDVP